MMSLIFLLVLLGTMCHTVFGQAFDMVMANKTLWYSEAAYCEPQGKTFGGNMAGFVMTASFDNGKNSAVGYVGYNSQDSMIVVAYRGSESINDWVTNLDAIQTSCPPEWNAISGCKVHKGFYNTVRLNTIDVVTDQVKALRAQFPSYQIMITGHSLGAALATITGLNLIHFNGLQNVNVFNFGSPRVGNDEFAQWASTQYTTFNRVTHHADMVVHCPPHQTYTHLMGEGYEWPNLSVKECTGYEDPSCSYQFSGFHMSISDHLFYLETTLGDDGCGPIGM